MVKKAVFFVKKGELKVETYTKDVDMKDDEVMIKVAYCGICGSDIHWLHNGELGPYPLQNEVYGHESSGIVTKVGSKVTSLKAGDMVCIEPFIPCTSYGCEPCKKGANNCCPHADSNAVTYGRSGFFRATNAWPENMCHKLPENMSLEEGALVEPVACATWSVKRSGLQGGNKVLVIGSGPIGLLCMMVAKAYGASKIIATDLNPKRLELASRAGADFSVLIDKNESPEAAAKRIVETLGEAPHVTLECTGSAPAINTGILATRRGGKLALVGLGESYVRVALTMASLREVDLLGVTRYNNTFPDAIELLSSGKIDSKVIISHVMGLDEAQKAFKMLIAGEGVKILLKCNDD